MLSHVLIFHGRRTCHARRPACGACPVAALCPSYGEGETDPVVAQGLLKFERATEPAGDRVTAPAPGWLPALAGRTRRLPGRLPGTAVPPGRRAPLGGADPVRPRTRHDRSADGVDVPADPAVRRACARTPGRWPSPAARSIPGDAGPEARGPARGLGGDRPGHRRCPGARVAAGRSTCRRRATSSRPVLAWWARPERRRPGRPARGRPRRAGPAGRAARPGQPVQRPPPERLRRPGLRRPAGCSSGASPPACWPGCSPRPGSKGLGTQTVPRAASSLPPDRPIWGCAVIDLLLVAGHRRLHGRRLSPGLRCVSALSLVGFLGGGALAMWLLPHAVRRLARTASTDLRSSLVLVGGVLLLAAAVGQGVGRRRGRPAAQPGPLRAGARGRLGARRRRQPGRDQPADLVRRRGGPRRRRARCRGRSGSRTSSRALDDVVPAQTAQLFSGFRSLLDRGGFPKVFESLGPERILPIDPPDAGGHRRPRRSGAAAASMVKITGVARSCSRSQEGSGWVVAPRAGRHQRPRRGRASARSRSGSAASGRRTRAGSWSSTPSGTSPSSTCPACRRRRCELGSDVGRGTSAVVAGFPQDGPYRLGAARVRQVLTATGQRHLRPARDRPAGLLALRQGPAGQLRRPAAVDPTGGSSASCSRPRWTTRTPAMR